MQTDTDNHIKKETETETPTPPLTYVVTLEQIEEHILRIRDEKQRIVDDAKRVVGELNAAEMALEMLCAPLRKARLNLPANTPDALTQEAREFAQVAHDIVNAAAQNASPQTQAQNVQTQV